MNPIEFFVTFLKASLFSTGGFGNLPSLHQDLIGNGWASEADFSKSLAVGQITPGPNGLWVLALGYFTYGIWGLVLALMAIIIPPFAILILLMFYRKIEHKPAVQAGIRGLSLGLGGLTLGVALTMTLSNALDWRGALIGATAFLLMLSGRVHVVFVLLGAAAGGLLLF
jgi:chromate transporter